MAERKLFALLLCQHYIAGTLSWSCFVVTNHFLFHQWINSSEVRNADSRCPKTLC